MRGICKIWKKNMAYRLQLILSLTPNSDKVLNKAKTIAEEKYSVIGILEDLESTFSALQAYVPKVIY